MLYSDNIFTKYSYINMIKNVLNLYILLSLNKESGISFLILLNSVMDLKKEI